MNNKEIQSLLKEKERRVKLKGYEGDFTSFAEEQIQILPRILA